MILITVLAMSVMATAALAQQNPCNPCGPKKVASATNPCGGMGTKTPAVPAVNPCHAKMGTVFYVADPMNRNTVTFTSRAPLEDIVGTTNQVSGYLVFDPENPKQGGRGELTVPAASLRTGIPLRDEHLASKDWLNARGYPKISFRIDQVKKVKRVKKTDSYQTYELKLAGYLTLHGKSKWIEDIPARITYLPESDMTRMKMPGDLLAGRANFEIALRDFGITGMANVVGSKVSDKISVEISFTASSSMPENAMAANPCNPCGGKKAMAANPCNPCGGKKAMAANPCNPCGGKVKVSNPCGGKATMNPCASKATNPCNPCSGKKKTS
jgi:polyisoprenoid-binding protein YceI